MYPSLPGIDDPATIRSIKAECRRRVDKLRFTIGPIGLAAVTAGGLSGVVAYGFRLTGIAAWFAMSVCVGVGIAVGHSAHRRLVLRVLPGVLHQHGRCTNCGYKLDESANRECPECGRAVVAPAPDEGAHET